MSNDESVPGTTGLELQRVSIVDGVNRSGEGLVTILAPAGYGKTVLAMQLAATAESSIFVDCSCVEPDFTCIARALAATACASVRPASADEVLLPLSGEGTLAVDLMEVLESCVSNELCVVLDDVVSDEAGAAIREISRIARNVHPNARVVVTSRDQAIATACAGEALIVGPNDLRMDSGEIRSLLQAAVNAEVSDDVVAKTLAATQGQAAALRLVARSMCLGKPEWVANRFPETVDFHAYLHDLASQQLNHEQLMLLYVISRLVTGDSSELSEMFGPRAKANLEAISLCIPLVSVDSGEFAASFCVHDLAIAAFTDREFVAEHVEGASNLTERILRVLDYRRDYERLFRVLLFEDDPKLLLEWAESRGRALLENGSLTVLGEVMRRLGPTSVLRSPQLLLLEAAALRERLQYREALKKASVAGNLADFESDDLTSAQSCMMMARLQMDLGRMREAAESLERAQLLGSDRLSTESNALIWANLALCYTCTGNVKLAVAAADAAAQFVGRRKMDDEILGRVTTSIAAATGVLSGRWDRVLDMCLTVEALAESSFGLRLQNLGNLGTVLCELGHLRRAEQAVESAIIELSRHRMDGMRHVFGTSLAAVKAGLGQYVLANQLMGDELEGLEQLGDSLGLAQSLVFQAAWQRADGDHGESLATAERVIELCTTLSCEWLEWQGLLEIASTLLAMGDSAGASRAAEGVRSLAVAVDARRHWLTADMIIAEVARRQGRVDEGIARFYEHEDYILTESANWQVAMYVRAFPHILGMIAAALGPDVVPVHLLRMILPTDVERTLAACGDILDEQEWRELATRVVGEGDITSLERMRETPQCYVRFFGGLEVRVGERSVGEKQWKKRKARLLFAMLVANRGREMPREQVFDLLWADMDEVRARNNFYVIWSAMKAALIPGADKTTPCPYVENLGGSCRAVRELVTSDIEEFEIALTELAEADRRDDKTRAIRLYEQLADIYSGELLPGDVYEEWFSQLRDRYRIEFGDAMLRACQLLSEEGDEARAVLMIRRGLRADPWREDLYQAALALQISLGQRSAAIETYIACRRRLADDLGLDPSSETMKLYERVLAMEDGLEVSEDDTTEGAE